jgi:hypothetical protein
MPGVGRRRRASVLVLVLAASCGGGAGTSSVTNGSPSASAGAVQVQVQARGCHTTRTGEVDIQMSFALPDRTSVAGYQGALEFHADLIRPESWTTVPTTPHLIDRPNSEIFHLIVPDGEPIPGTLELHVRAAASDATQDVSAAAVSELAGSKVSTPFGTTVLGAVEASTGSLTVQVPVPAGPLGTGVTVLGPGSATLQLGGKSFEGSVTTAAGHAQLRFDVASATSGQATLTLGSWTLDLRPDVSLVVPVGVCTAG